MKAGAPSATTSVTSNTTTSLLLLSEELLLKTILTSTAMHTGLSSTLLLLSGKVVHMQVHVPQAVKAVEQWGQLKVFLEEAKFEPLQRLQSVENWKLLLLAGSADGL